MHNLKGKRLLILGGKPIGSCEIVEKAKAMGIHTIVADYLPAEQSAAKRISDEHWEISTADIEALKEKITQSNIDGIYTGVHEFNIRKMIELCEILDFPCFCSLKQWDFLNDKRKFKDLCKKYQIPVSKEYDYTLIKDGDKDVCYPVIVKPSDGSGSRGFSICNNIEELALAYKKAVEFSKNGEVLIEQYMNYKDSAIINYTVVDGNFYFSGISDKHSKKVFESGAPIMSVQFYPSKYEKEYLEKLNDKAIKMFSNFGIKNGVIWIEAFCKNGEFTFNEMGFRFGGSLTYLPVQHFYGIDQLKLQIEYALTGKTEQAVKVSKNNEDFYCILPVHVKPGTIKSVEGLQLLKQQKETVKIVPVHFEGDIIENWGSAQQVFAYIHFCVECKEKADDFMDLILENLKVYDENRNNLLFNLYR